VGSTLELTIERSGVPLHAAIARKLTDAILAGDLVPGSRLPPERELASSLGVSRMTVRQALGELERQGHLRRVVGRAGGTFVTEPADAGTRSVIGLSEGLLRGSGATGVEVVSVVVEPPGRRVASALGLGRNGRVVVITRLRLVGGKPLAVERSSLPAALFPDVEEMDVTGSLVELMAGFGVRATECVERLELVEARPQDARTLGVRRGAPLFLLERIRSGSDGIPVEFARDRFRCDRARLVLESTRPAA
jgi:GntR family transcriptional regulator